MNQLLTQRQNATLASELEKHTLDELFKLDELERQKDDELHSYFHNITNRKTVEELLTKAYNENSIDGLFLLRPSSRGKMDLGLSLIYKGNVYHYHLKHVYDIYFSIEDARVFCGIEDAITYFTANNELACLLSDYIEGQPIPKRCRLTGIINVLHKACSSGDFAIAEKILNSSYDIDINERDIYGSTALHIACQLGYDDIVSLLLSKGAAVDKHDADGCTALHRAAQDNHPTTVLMLLDASADPNICELRKMTPLHIAAENNSYSCVSVLLEFGVAKCPRDLNGKTPLDIATEQNAQESIDILNAFRAPVPISDDKDWLHPALTKDETRKMFYQRGDEDGMFLIRKRNDNNGYALSLMHDKQFYNYEINEEDNDKFSIPNGPIFESLAQLVDHYMKFSDRLPTKLRIAIAPEHFEDHIKQNSTDDMHAEKSKAHYSVYADIQSAKHTPLPRLPSTSGSTKSSTCSSTKSASSGSKVGKVPRYVKHFNSMNMVPVRKNAIIRPVKQPARFTREHSTKIAVIGAEKLHLARKLGEGEFGVVYEGFYYPTSNSRPIAVAIKQLKLLDEESIKEFKREANIMGQLKHHCIVKIYGVVMNGGFMMVQELLPYGSLLDMLHKSPHKITMNHMKKWAMQIAQAMNYMESKKFVHRDLAARNVLLASLNQVKVSDFGLSRSTGNYDVYRQQSNGKIPIKWYAPEAIEYGRFTSKSDVWSYGVTLWEIFAYGKEPYEEMSSSEVYEYIKRGNKLERPRLCPMSTYRVMRKCWDLDEKQRPRFASLLEYFSHEQKLQNWDRNNHSLQSTHTHLHSV